MDKDKHVYCSNCIHGKALFTELMREITNFQEPEACYGCDSRNPEDSTRYENRPNYVESDQ